MGGAEHLTWDEVIELNKQGISFGSHTASHPILKCMRRDEVKFEIEQSKQIIESKTGSLSIPSRILSLSQKRIRLWRAFLHYACILRV